MRKIILNLDKNKKYVVACSYGPDSMALLDAAIKENLKIVVAHVDYRKRNVSFFEQKSLEKYCKTRNIRFYVLDLLGVEHKGNFQQWAREKRYDFFKEIARKEECDAVLVAHQEDDLIETYLMQKNRGNFSKYAGISRENEINGVMILRPLLSYSKQFLKDYDDENKIPYSIDESNLKNDYTRNKIRHEIVEKMNENARKNVIFEIEKANSTSKKIEIIRKKDSFIKLNYEEILLILNHFMDQINEHRDISRGFASEIVKSFKTRATHRIQITESFALELDYDDIYFLNTKKLRNYNCEFFNKFENSFLEIDFSGGTIDRKIDLKNKKLIVKNCDKKDVYIICNYSCKINRLFIDWKMPLFLREIWPGIYDEKGKLVYVPRYKKQFEDNHQSKFVINTKYFELKSE